MTSAVKSPYSSEQITAWLRGLLTIAWADGNFDPEEQQLITSLTKDELALGVELDSLEIITPEELAAKLGKRTAAAENFTRTAVMVAIANGTYSPSEDQVMQQLCEALEQPKDILESLRHTLAPTEEISSLAPPEAPPHDVLCPLRDWLDGLEIHDPRVARFLCKMIPSQCPFERDITLFGRKIVHIPPLCQINPLYEQLVGLRFRALSYLADECGEDISPYI
ncbi:Mo-dependent nitrogenase C-terminal domain-containing protein [Nodularia spumigena]|uniref:Mo-dependent nitrogenase C-terminal domain-containing protein n=1 Tax=Nodularia spumigena UHCC 0060 TaxID=3110300 RepID=A0ABU5UVL8_NODSP|nr:Mo-dependent nitrogenase C-terminal domain-containing protein [Nodularia spumigena]MEA5527440.1 Mo-dependent nitrogenase C-terminal domain-containing protein [Nodularia spumigena UHCC 0143]MEA5609987.1 Mo-dependent nitrogenase C-terminal domain-containing protein [Nodularia spumigena UHCC 0060]MEA5613510.1 Mo-dependent nitrogenase C-terminal domain-containing protein [Nodularia spumigena UHCC 0040]